jgi:hypothetical protein
MGVDLASTSVAGEASFLAKQRGACSDETDST